MVTHRFGAVFGDGDIGRQTVRDGTDFGRLREQPGKRQRTGQDEMGGSPVRVDFDRFAQALDTANHSPEIDIGKADEKVPEKRCGSRGLSRIASSTWARVSPARPRKASSARDRRVQWRDCRPY